MVSLFQEEERKLKMEQEELLKYDEAIARELASEIDAHRVIFSSILFFFRSFPCNFNLISLLNLVFRWRKYANSAFIRWRTCQKISFGREATDCHEPYEFQKWYWKSIYQKIIVHEA